MAISQSPPIQKLNFIIFSAEASVFTLLFFLFEGYQFGVGNQPVFLPVIEAFGRYPHLANDFGVSARTYYHPFFNISMAWLSCFVPLSLVFFVIQTFLILIIYVTLRKLSSFFFSSSRVYWGGIFLMFLWAQQGIDDNVLWVNRLEAQYLAWPCILAAFSAYLSSKWGRAGLWTGAICLLHFQLGVITGIILITLAIISEPMQRHRSTLTFLAGSAVLGIPVFCYSLHSIFMDHFLIGPAFMPFATLRASHHMLFDLRLAILFILLALIPSTILKISKLRAQFSSLQINFIERLERLQMTLLLFGAAQYTDYYLHIGVLSRLQFLRLFPFVYLTGVLFLAHFLLQLLRTPTYRLMFLSCLAIFLIGPRLITYQSLRENWIYAFITLVAMGFSILLKNRHVKNIGFASLVLFFPLAWCSKTVSLSPQAGFSFHPAPFLWNAERQTKDPWVDICQKTGQSSSESDLVLSPPYMNGFVYFSKRKTLVEFKSNGVHKKTYLEWLKRLTLAGGGKPLQNCSGMNCLDKIKQEYNQLEPAQIDEIIRLYGAAFFVTESTKVYPYELQYANGTYKLYRLRPSAKVNTADNPL